MPDVSELFRHHHLLNNSYLPQILRMIIHQDKDQLTDKLYRLNLIHNLLYLEIQFDMDLREQQS